MLAEDGVERLVNERTLAASAHTCYADHLSQGDLHRHVFEIIAGATREGNGDW